MKISLQHGDLTKVVADAIVNAANSSLLGGGGVDGAIHRAGGSQILKECREIRNRQGGCKVGEAVYTSAGNLNSKVIIHTVGPKWNNGLSNEMEKLKKCYENALRLAQNLNVETIAFPNISTGIYGYPKDKAAAVAIDAVSSFSSSSIKEVIFVCFDIENYSLYKQLLK